MSAPHVFPRADASHWEDDEDSNWLGIALLILIIVVAGAPFVWLLS